MRRRSGWSWCSAWRWRRCAGAGDRQSPAPVIDSGSAISSRPPSDRRRRGGWLFARADGDWFTFVTDRLSLDKRDFSPGFAADVGIPLGRRAEAIIGGTSTQTTTASDTAFRGQQRLPITQTTQLDDRPHG
jgi:hypothetical protein